MQFFSLFWLLTTIILIVSLMKSGENFSKKKKVSSDQLMIIISLCQTSVILIYIDFINSIYTFFSGNVFTGGPLIAIDGISDGVITIMPIVFDLIVFSLFLSFNRRHLN